MLFFPHHFAGNGYKQENDFQVPITSNSKLKLCVFLASGNVIKRMKTLSKVVKEDVHFTQGRSLRETEVKEIISGF